MKKITKLILVVLCLTLALASCFALVGCGKTENVKVIEIKLTDEDYAFATKKGNTELITEVNEILAEMKEDGTLAEIFDKHFTGKKVEKITSAKKDSSKDQLVVATNAAFPPFEYFEGDKFAGIDMEIAKIIADKMGKELVIEHKPFDSVLIDTQNGLCDLGMAGLTVTPDRQKIYEFTNTYFKASQMVIVRESDTTFDNCETAADVEAVLASLQKKKAGYQTGTTGGLFVRGDADWGFDGFSNLTPMGFSNGALAVKKLMQGGIDLVIIDEMPAKSIVKQLNK